MLPIPTLTFTIPSVHDDTVLDCRIYFPPQFLTTGNYQAPWRKKAAIVAHPYAPLGGCYDDPVVQIVVSQLLKEQFVTGTFNFRGAGISKGHTSWTSKAEIKDYISMIGFMIYLMHGLYRPQYPCNKDSFLYMSHGDSLQLSPVPSQALPPPHAHSTAGEEVAPEDFPTSNKKLRSEPLEPDSLLVIAGYSYGALITTQLPDMSYIMELFRTPNTGSAASEIRLRAQQLAKQQNEIFARLLAKPESKSDTALNELPSSLNQGRSLQASEVLSSRKVSAASSVRVGGEETDISVRRASQDSHGRHSFAFDAPERVRRSVDRVRSLGGHASSEQRLHLPRRQTSSPDKKPSPASVTSSSSVEPVEPAAEIIADSLQNMPLVNLGNIKIAYLLISPLQGLVNNLATMWSFTPQNKGKRKKSKAGEICEEEGKLVDNPTLAIFGDHDVFTSCKKLRAWGCKLRGFEMSKFMYVEVSGAGHFWQEDGTAGKMRGAVTEFVRGL